MISTMKNVMRKYGYIILFAGMLVYILYKIGVRQATIMYLMSDTVAIRAVIIDERNFWGNSPVSHEHSNSYIFFVNGQSYTNDSHDSKLLPGDSIDVIYNKRYPFFNRPR